jgi:hypothetical protein
MELSKLKNSLCAWLFFGSIMDERSLQFFVFILVKLDQSIELANKWLNKVIQERL